MGLPIHGPGGIATVTDEEGNEVQFGEDCVVSLSDARLRVRWVVLMIEGRSCELGGYSED
jgi:hypothetical protein